MLFNGCSGLTRVIIPSGSSGKDITITSTELSKGGFQDLDGTVTVDYGTTNLTAGHSMDQSDATKNSIIFSTAQSPPDGAQPGAVTLTFAKEVFAPQAEYDIAPVTLTITVPAPGTASFDANGGSGTIEPMPVSDDCSALIPPCAFTPPPGYFFNCWENLREGQVVERVQRRRMASPMRYSSIISPPANPTEQAASSGPSGSPSPPRIPSLSTTAQTAAPTPWRTAWSLTVSRRLSPCPPAALPPSRKGV